MSEPSDIRLLPLFLSLLAFITMVAFYLVKLEHRVHALEVKLEQAR